MLPTIRDIFYPDSNHSHDVLTDLCSWHPVAYRGTIFFTTLNPCHFGSRLISLGPLICSRETQSYPRLDFSSVKPST